MITFRTVVGAVFVENVHRILRIHVVVKRLDGVMFEIVRGNGQIGDALMKWYIISWSMFVFVPQWC